MADASPTARTRLRGYTVLGVAVVVAAAVTAYLFAAGGDDGPVPAGGGSFSPGTTATAERDPDLGVLTPARPEIGEPAPDFALVDARDGSVRRLSDFRGTPVIVNWYASWCGPCRDEIPEFTAMLDVVGRENVAIVGVDYQESAGSALSILDEYGADYVALLDSDGSVADHFRVGNRLPSSFFVDADGVLRGFRLGVLRAEDLVEQLATVGISYKPVE